MNKSVLRILILDDEQFMREVLVRKLAELGFEEVATCDNGAAALACIDAAASVPDLILLDLNMPQMDGVEFVRRLVEHNYRGSLILVSGEAERVLQMTEKLIQAHRIPVLGYVRKPVSTADLAKMIGEWKPAPLLPRLTKAYGPAEVCGALANNELVNYYQPKVAVATGAVVGVETLVRWRHPTDGIVLPEQFVGVAEAHGLIDELTRFVLAAALAQARSWQEAGLPLRVAVNVSMDNLASLEFADFVAGTAVAAGVTPEDIVLELTESRYMLDHRTALESLTRLRLKRFRLSIDDFGTGHSSLSQLSDIRFDELKIDRSFVHAAWRDETARAIYFASLALGKQLGLEVVAEGVEDKDDWDLVRSSDCDTAQGNFIARAMPADELAQWVRNGSLRVGADSWRSRR